MGFGVGLIERRGGGGIDAACVEVWEVDVICTCGESSMRRLEKIRALAAGMCIRCAA